MLEEKGESTKIQDFVVHESITIDLHPTVMLQHAVNKRNKRLLLMTVSRFVVLFLSTLFFVKRFSSEAAAAAAAKTKDDKDDK